MNLILAFEIVTCVAVSEVVASTVKETLRWVTVKILNDGEDMFEDVISFKN